MTSSQSLLSRRQALTGGALVAAGVGARTVISPSSALATDPSTVQPTVRHVAVPGVDAAAARRLPARELDTVSALSPAVAATGYATVGVIWAPGSSVEGSEVSVRTQTAGAWSAWQPLHVDGEHGPSAGSVEAAKALPGSDPVAVGRVDAVQVKLVSVTGASRPAGLTLAVVDPGEPTAAQRSAERRRPAYRARHGSRTARPGIYSRKQWGANESMRDGFAGYGTIRAGFVHHTVNSNYYTRGDVPSIMRGIYAYHTQSQGWSDIGYNFLVDRFGRIWEGRWGGIRRPVIGAHTYGYNYEAFAMSAIGNFEEATPRKAMLRAYKKLFAWKLTRHHVRGGGSTTINGTRLKTISGHRDVGSTACPGRKLYARLPKIRHRVRAAQGH